jgi:hypothetical protein
MRFSVRSGACVFRLLDDPRFSRTHDDDYMVISGLHPLVDL